MSLKNLCGLKFLRTNRCAKDACSAEGGGSTSKPSGGPSLLQICRKRKFCFEERMPRARHMGRSGGHIQDVKFVLRDRSELLFHSISNLLEVAHDPHPVLDKCRTRNPSSRTANTGVSIPEHSSLRSAPRSRDPANPSPNLLSWKKRNSHIARYYFLRVPGK